MRVAFVCLDPGVPVFGSKGCSIHVQEMTRFFLEAGFRVTLYTPRPDLPAPEEFSRVEVRELPAHSGHRFDRETHQIGLNPRLISMLESDGPFHVIYERYSLFSYAGMIYARQNSIPGILEVNAPLIDEQSQYRGLVRVADAERTSRDVIDAASSVIAVSEAVKEYIMRLTGRTRAVHVVPNGVDTDRFGPGIPPALPRVPERFTVGFVGSLKPWHGLGDLVNAFRMFVRTVPDSRLLIVGDGPEREALEFLIEQMGLSSHVELAGRVPHDQVPGLLASMDVAVAPYPQERNNYFSPLKIFEYLAAGLPVVATASGQIPDIIEDGKTGLIVPPGCPDRLAAAIRTLHADRQLAIRIGRAAREQAMSRHTWRGTGRRILETGGLRTVEVEAAA